MDNNSIILWKNTDIIVLPKKIAHISELFIPQMQLSNKDQKQIIKTFEDGSYEMVSTYIWTKAINSLKVQLSKMGISFIAEMLDKPEINEYTNLQEAISEFEAIRLAEELGVISGTAAFRLKKAMETVSHFNQPDLTDDPENDLTEDEAKSIIRACIQGVLGYEKIDVALDFKNFRLELENSTLTPDNQYVYKLIRSPYFFHRATIRILLSLIKSSTGAQLENSLANSNLIIPQIWNGLKHPEKYQIGRSYSELFSDGKSLAASGLKQALLKVKGFDFVPEDLRSTSFIKIANEILSAHDGSNNFYNEPTPVKTLYKMGSVIPIPSFSICMTAILSVKLGNYWGVSFAAQESANAIIKNVTKDRWVYFFNECMQTNDRILYKLTLSNPIDRWINCFPEQFIDNILPDIKRRDIQYLLKYTRNKDVNKIKKLANEMFVKLGYTNE